MTNREDIRDAAMLFAERDELEAQLARVDKHLQAALSKHMVESRMWGISMSAFRSIVQREAASLAQKETQS
jgi:hypothetical protein